MDSRKIDTSYNVKVKSQLIKAMRGWTEPLEGFEQAPKGVFGSIATVKCGNVSIDSKKLDLDFEVNFDDDLEANDATITVYNLSANTIGNIKKGASISITAGYTDDTGVLFSGFVHKVQTKYEGADKVTTITCLDDVKDHTVESISFSEGTKASYILKQLIEKTKLPVAVFKTRRDFTYENEQTVDGDLMSAIKQYSAVCGVSTYINRGKVYSRYIKDGDNISFSVSEQTGMIGYPEPFEEEQKAEDFKETVNGYKIKMLLQHRMTTAAIVNLKSTIANGKFRVRGGRHSFTYSGEAITEIEVI